MEEISKKKLFNQFGYRMDIIDSYRTAVDRSNHGALRTLAVITTLVGLLVSVYELRKPLSTGAAISAVLAAAGLLGLRTGLKKQPKRWEILSSIYLIFVCFYAMAVYGTITRNTEVFWVGIQMGLCCYVLDYAWRVLTLQGVSYLAMLLTWIYVDGQTDKSRIMFQTGFLLCGMVTFYALARTKLSMILSREESRQQADTDLLTGLTIRNAAQEAIEEELGRSDESGVLMLLDLDHFKSVNDRLGHQKGDQVLIDVAADLRRMFRATDILSRLGGDEFIIYMQGVPEEGWAMRRAEQVVRTVRRWVSDGTTNIQISASIGVVMTQTIGRTYTDLYRAADIAMYLAKARGGNEAILYTRELIEQARSSGETLSRAADERTLAEHNEMSDALR